MPPSINKWVPVIKPAGSETKYATVAANSSGVPSLPNGMRLMRSLMS